MAGFDFKNKADWNSGFKNNVVGDDDVPVIDVDKLAIAPEFFDSISGGSRKAGWTEDVSGTSSIVDTVGSPNYMKVIQQYSGLFAHVQRPPPPDALPPNFNRLVAVCHLKAIDDNNTVNWNPGMAIYWDVNNWCRIRLDMVANEMITQANINGTVFDLTSGTPFPISLNTWYEVLLYLHFDGSHYFYDAWCRVPHGTFYPIGSSIPVSYWDFDPPWLIFGPGYSDDPSYPNPDFDNNAAITDSQRESHMSKFAVWPLNGQAGSWQSPSITMPSGQQLQEVILEQDYGSADSYINIVNILRASDDVVLSTWTGSIQGDQTLYSDDFDNGFDITKDVDIKVEVWLWSESSEYWSELDRVAGNFKSKWGAQETLGVSDDFSSESQWAASESLGLSDKILSSVVTTFRETLGLSDVQLAHMSAVLQETLGISDVEAASVVAKFIESLGLSDTFPFALSTTFGETLGLSDDIFYLSEVLVGIRGIIAPPLDITDFDFCETVLESGHTVTKKGTPDVSFKAYFYRKQTSQSFDIAIQTLPGDAVMFYCPELEVIIEVGDILEHNALEYEVIAIREKEHDGNLIYRKAACQFQREVGVPQVLNPAATSPSAGQALATWDEVETTAYPAFDHYEVWMQKGTDSYQLVIETAGVSHTQRNLVADTYKFKIRAIDKVGLQGTFSSEASVVVA